MQDFLTWGAIIASGGSLVALIKFWMAMGAAQARADAAAQNAAIAAAKADLMQSQLNEFKVDVARTYATAKALSDTEAQLLNSFERAMQGIYIRLDGLTTRIDNLITITKEQH